MYENELIKTNKEKEWKWMNERMKMNEYECKRMTDRMSEWMDEC